MVSLQSPNHRTTMILEAENSIPAQKRKALEGSQALVSDHHQKRPKAEFQNFMADIELHLETPLPSEWQRCLDIQSGKIHFYNTKTQARTSTDPRKTNTSLEGGDDNQNSTSLDLELNLTTSSRTSMYSIERPKEENNNKRSSPPAPWLAAEVERRQEMVATVCMRCHMLVMLCRSSPACPNCKFVHPPDKAPSTSFVQVKF